MLIDINIIVIEIIDGGCEKKLICLFYWFNLLWIGMCMRCIVLC